MAAINGVKAQSSSKGQAAMGSLKCRVRAGSVFPHERDVLIRGRDGDYEVIVDAKTVQDRAEGDAELPVGIVKADEDSYLVELPRQVIMGGSRIWVNKDDVVLHAH